MIKNWKSLFVKSDEEVAPLKMPTPKEPENFAFPTINTANTSGIAAVQNPIASNKTVEEVLQVYEQGLDSINMPGYDFFEFYKAVSMAGNPSSQLYNMAFQMAIAMDKTLSIQKLTSDAEFYISKINEVHSQFSGQGQQKLNTINEAKISEKSKLSNLVEQASLRISQLRVELQNLEKEVLQSREKLAKVDDDYSNDERSIRNKLAANDQARQISIAKLTAVKDGITNYIK